MDVKTSRFGTIKINESDLITLKEGILGFEEETNFCIIDPNDQTLILWLQSTKNPAIAFPIVEPQIFRNDYNTELLASDLNSLKITENTRPITYVILTIPSDISLMSANFKAPIVINSNNSEARQIVLQNNKLEVKRPVYKELKIAITQMKASDDETRSSYEGSSTDSQDSLKGTENVFTPVRVPRQET